MTLVEFRKQFIRVRTYVALGFMVLLPTILTVVFKVRGGPGHDQRDNGFFALATHSGLNMPLAALSAMSTFLLPIVVALVAGSALSEEASWGNLRYLLLRPVSRGRVLSAKLAVVASIALVATVVIAVVATVEGVAAFGWHPVVTPSAAVLSPSVALGRLAISTLYVAWCMSVVLAFAFLLSTMTDAPMGAVAGGFGLAVISEILNGIPPLGNVRSFLPTHYWHAWESLFASSVSVDHIVRGVLLPIPYVVVFLVFAWWWFRRKDILT